MLGKPRQLGAKKYFYRKNLLEGGIIQCLFRQILLLQLRRTFGHAPCLLRSKSIIMEYLLCRDQQTLKHVHFNNCTTSSATDNITFVSLYALEE